MDQDDILKSARQKAEQGRASEMTPQEMDAFGEWSKEKSEAHADGVQRRQEAARRKFTDRDREIFGFVRREFNRIEANEGYDSDKHDGPVLAKAAERFGITKEEAKRIFIEVEGAGLDLA